jgi:Tfp pilus assembly protein PilV
MTKLPLQRRVRQAGFTLIEALIALLVMSFGMLALAGMQMSMTRSADVGKQRSEAVRLAQLKMEDLRSFDGLNSGSFTYSANVVSTPVGADETICPTCAAPLDSVTNTSFTRHWDVMRSDGVTPATATDAQKWINVTVTWTDRTGLTQEVRLNSVIARNDPIALKGFVAGQARAKVRYPKNRHVNIPYPAVALPGGLSGFKPPPGANNYVFDNRTGNVLGSCTDAAIAASISTGTAIRFSGTVTTGCTAGAGYLLSGYVRFKTTGSSPTASNIVNLNDATLPLAATVLSPQSGPLVIDYGTTGNGPASYVCYSQRQKVVSINNVQPSSVSSASRSGNVVTVTTSGNHGLSVGNHVAIEGAADYTFNGSFEILAVPTNTSFTYAQVAPNASTSGGTASLIQQLTVEESVSTPGYNSINSRFIAYTCVVTPGTDQAGTAWWGEVRLVTDGTWSFGTSSSTYKVCRFSGDYIADNAVSNHEHPRYYRRVTGTLDNQNFLVIKGNDDCPTDVNSDPVAGDLVNTATVTHQPSPELSFVCTNTACSGSNKVQIEPSTATVAAPMSCPLTTAGCT